MAPGSNTVLPTLGQGKEKARNYLIENPEVAQEIRTKIMAAGGYIDDVAEKVEESEQLAGTTAS